MAGQVQIRILQKAHTLKKEVNEILREETMRTQCHSKLLEFEGRGPRRLVAKKLIFLLVFLRGPSCPFVDIFFLRTPFVD